MGAPRGLLNHPSYRWQRLLHGPTSTRPLHLHLHRTHRVTCLGVPPRGSLRLRPEPIMIGGTTPPVTTQGRSRYGIRRRLHTIWSTRRRRGHEALRGQRSGVTSPKKRRNQVGDGSLPLQSIKMGNGSVGKHHLAVVEKREGLEMSPWRPPQ